MSCYLLHYRNDLHRWILQRCKLCEAFSNSDASVGLAIGSLFGLLITILLYVIRGVLDFGKCMEAIPEGFKAMVPAILILTFAWTLKGTDRYDGCKGFCTDSNDICIGKSV